MLALAMAGKDQSAVSCEIKENSPDINQIESASTTANTPSTASNPA